MQIILPMSGFGERFRKAGYRTPKYLIEVEGKPIIAHVIDLFPGEKNITFICNKDHVKKYHLQKVLKKYCPTAKIISIAAHKKGPVHTVLQAKKHFDNNLPTIVNYCDFTCYWNFAHFKKWVKAGKLDAALPAYRGFHPHSLHGNYYAYIRENKFLATGIQEKKPFTTSPMDEFASTGTYYFKSGKLMLSCFKEAVAEKLTVNNEFYVSMAYQPLIARKARVGVYEIQHFMQWGTPEDFKEYQKWSDIFRLLVSRKETQPKVKGTVMVPMAGLGERFRSAGYKFPKPLIPVSGQPMVIQATNDLPKPEHYQFILREKMREAKKLCQSLAKHYPGCGITSLKHPTQGQAHSCLLGMLGVAKALPLTIGACDNGALYDAKKLEALMKRPDIDIIVWVARSLTGAARKPQMYSWAITSGARLTKVSVKKPLKNPENDPIVIGTFTFKRAGDFKKSADAMIANNDRVNGEFYVDSCINHAIALGLKCAVFEIDAYLCWGTPDELKSFEYWQSCFHKWESHPYSLSNDMNVVSAAKLEKLYRAITPKNL